MANDLQAVTPRLLAQGLLALREVAIMPMLVNRAYEAQAGQKGSTIDVPIPSAIAAQDVVPANIPPSTPDVSPTSVPIALDQWKEAPFYLTDRDILTAMDGTIPMQASEAIKSLANYVNIFILSRGIKFFGYYGVPGIAPFTPAAGHSGVDTDTSSATGIRKVLNNQLAPVDNRHVVFDPDAEANALNLRAFQDVSWSGDPDAILRGRLNQRLGFQWWMHQLVQYFTAGTAAGITLTANAAAGDGSAYPRGIHTGAGVYPASTPTGTALQLMAATPGTLVQGDILTFAGDSQSYVVTTPVTLNATTATPVYIYPGLQQAQPTATATPVAVTKLASHVMNLAFHRDAFAFATRPLQNVEPGLGSLTEVAVDPVSQLALRLEVTREHKRTRFSYDILFGCDVVRPELGARLVG